MLKRDGVRILTTGEIALAKELYAYSIHYNEVWVHHGSYLPFGVQNNNTAMTPNGEIWFETNVYSDDFSLELYDAQHLFMHEMMHVWQHQKGMNVRMRGVFSWAADYTYDLSKKRLADYSMEQQACIVSDFWLLIKYGKNEYKTRTKYKNHGHYENITTLTDKYKNLLSGFPS